MKFLFKKLPEFIQIKIRDIYYLDQMLKIFVKGPFKIAHNHLFQKTRYFSTIMPRSSTSFYDWTHPETLRRVIQEEYILDDLYQGFEELKKRMVNEKRTLYKAEQLHFLIYASMVLKNYDQILKQFINGLANSQAVANLDEHVPKYLIQAKQILKINEIDESITRKIKLFLMKRLQHPSNTKTITDIHRTIQDVACPELGNLTNIYKIFKQKVHQECEEKQFQIPRTRIREILQLFDFFYYNDTHCLKNSLFFTEFPEFEHNEQVFQNLLKFLLELTTQNFLFRYPKGDMLSFHRRFERCAHFKQPKTKKLLNQYACQLASEENIVLVNFTKILDRI